MTDWNGFILEEPFALWEYQKILCWMLSRNGFDATDQNIESEILSSKFI